MSTTGTSFRRGTSTILGTLIFVGIMFTAVIPMLLVMRQADTLHEMRKHELGILDQEKAMENLCLYVCPEGPSSPNVEVTIVNNGEVLAHVIKIWINDTSSSVDIDIPSMSEEVLVLELDLVEGMEYDIRATTDRGNVFVSENGILRYEEGGWEMETFSIRIFTSGFTWHLHIKVHMGDETGPLIYDEWEWVGKGGYEVIVPQPGDYYVLITWWDWGSPGIFEDIVNIPWPIGDPWVWVFV